MIPARTINPYFIQCPKYDAIRRDMISLVPVECLNVDVFGLLHGSPRYATSLNLTILKATQIYVISSGRFI